MPQVGKIDVSFAELRAISQECVNCADELKAQLDQCNHIMNGLMDDGWQSDSGYKLYDEFANLAETNFDNYLEQLCKYAQFCETTIAEYAKTEGGREAEIGGSRLQNLE